MSEFSFNKKEKIKSRKEIDQILTKGKKQRNDLILLRWIEHKDLLIPPVKVLVTVPKKKFKRAVDRNLLKRRMREAYRLNKTNLVEKCGAGNKSLSLMFIYQAEDIRSFAEIENKIVLLLKGLLPSNETDS